MFIGNNAIKWHFAFFHCISVSLNKFCIQPSFLMILCTLKAKKYFQTININDSVSWVKYAVWSDRSTYCYLEIYELWAFVTGRQFLATKTKVKLKWWKWNENVTWTTIWILVLWLLSRTPHGLYQNQSRYFVWILLQQAWQWKGRLQILWKAPGHPRWQQHWPREALGPQPQSDDGHLWGEEEAEGRNQKEETPVLVRIFLTETKCKIRLIYVGFNCKKVG